jgi:predicted nucleotidyltransferase
MRAVGLITEYNPFHNGHLHHLRASREASGAEVAVAVMSGHFLQRGEPALLDKWRRTEIALRCGVDLVLELPFVFACASAPDFARGAVACLDALGVEALCFGNEGGDLEGLARCAALLDERAADIEAGSAALLRQGLSFPAARARVVAQLANGAVDGKLLATPNNILGIAYLRALRSLGSAITPLTIPRLGAGYHDLTVGAGNIASATGIRRRLADGEAVTGLLPAAAEESVRQTLAAGLSPDYDLLHRLLLARLFQGRDALRSLHQVEHGLEGRLFKAAMASRSWEDLVQGVKSRQFTRTRIQRLLIYLLNAVPADEAERLLADGPRYLHLLGCSERGRRYLATVRRRARLPLLANLSRARAQLLRHYGGETEAFRQARSMLDLDVRATCNYTLLLPGWQGERRDRDYFETARQTEEKQAEG